MSCHERLLELGELTVETKRNLLPRAIAGLREERARSHIFVDVRSRPRLALG
jgi:hypothetical protein